LAKDVREIQGTASLAEVERFKIDEAKEVLFTGFRVSIEEGFVAKGKRGERGRE